MAQALGVCTKKGEILLAIADDGRLLDDRAHSRVQAPALLDETERTQGFLNDVGRVLAEVRPVAVRILQPETTWKASYADMAPRAALETLVRLACAQADVFAELVHPSTVRARLGLARSGSLDSHVNEVVTTPLKPYWSQGRNLAALAALAEPT